MANLTMKQAFLQAKSSREYWRDREDTQAIITEQTMEQFDAEVQTVYESMVAECEKEIRSFYQKYADNQDITLAEAKKRVSKMDVKAYEKEAERLVKTKELTDKAKEELKLYNATMKINRLRMLEANIGLHLVNGYSDLERMTGRHLTDETIKEYRRQAGILGGTIIDTETRAKNIVKQSFHNATWSERIWTNQTALRNVLSTELMKGLIGGNSSDEIAANIRKKFNVSSGEAKRLARTELVRCQAGAQLDSYKEHGWREYEFLAYGSRSCEVCRALNGKHYSIEDAMPAENMPPIHPNCRCRTAPYEDEDEYQRWLDSFRKSTETLDFSGQNNTMNVRAMANGLRRSFLTPLTEDDKNFIRQEIKAIKADPNAFEFVDYVRTAYYSDEDKVVVSSNVFPSDDNSTNPTDMLSVRAVLAHEYYGHRRHRNTKVPANAWNDEFRASYDAAKYCPNLSLEERAMLITDAMSRAKSAGVNIVLNDFMKEVLYGY